MVEKDLNRWPHIYKSTCPCDKCGEVNVSYYQTGDHDDSHIKCFSCGHSYWIDGDDG